MILDKQGHSAGMLTSGDKATIKEADENLILATSYVNLFLER